MNHFQYKNGNLFCEEVAVSEIAKEVGTPFYLYSKATLVRHLRHLIQVLKILIILPVLL